MDKYEKVVYDYYNNKSKKSVAFRFQDTKDATQKIKGFQKNSFVPLAKNPSDFVITDDGKTFYAEIKHTESTLGLTSSLFDQQKGLRDRVISSNGLYFYFIYSVNINQWYKIPGEVIKNKANQKWKDLGKYMINYLPNLM